jgi:hypothetical protein
MKTKKSLTIAGVSAEIRKKNLPNESKYYHYTTVGDIRPQK